MFWTPKGWTPKIKDFVGLVLQFLVCCFAQNELSGNFPWDSLGGPYDECFGPLKEIQQKNAPIGIIWQFLVCFFAHSGPS